MLTPYKTICEKCNGDMIGDGYTSVMHCEHVDEDISHLEPDANPVYCNFEDEEENDSD